MLGCTGIGCLASSAIGTWLVKRSGSRRLIDVDIGFGYNWRLMLAVVGRNNFEPPVSHSPLVQSLLPSLSALQNGVVLRRKLAVPALWK